MWYFTFGFQEIFSRVSSRFQREVSLCILSKEWLSSCDEIQSVAGDADLCSFLLTF